MVSAGWMGEELCGFVETGFEMGATGFGGCFGEDCGLKLLHRKL